MRVAQSLYEDGLITYMRTDGVDMAEEAISAARKAIANRYDSGFVPDKPRRYTSKAKNAQEAHEAIRPTDMGRLPKQVSRYLSAEEARLYELIWIRTVASQMESAELERTTADITATPGGRIIDLRATGTVVKFDGFLTLYQEGEDDAQDDDEEDADVEEQRAAEPEIAILARIFKMNIGIDVGYYNVDDTRPPCAPTQAAHCISDTDANRIDGRQTAAGEVM